MVKVVADQKARGGGQGRPVLYVLVVSLVLAAFAMMGYALWGGFTTPTTPPQQTAPTPTQPAPAPPR